MKHGLGIRNEEFSSCQLNEIAAKERRDRKIGRCQFFVRALFSMAWSLHAPRPSKTLGVPPTFSFLSALTEQFENFH